MGEATAIAWTDHTFNPWWGCTKVSAACDHCYAEAFAKRTGHDVWGKGAPRRFFGDKHWAEPLRWQGRVFCASMADVFERDDRLDEHRARLWDLINATPHLTWQLLTKRPENIRTMVPSSWLTGWPPHVWIGTTVEDHMHATIRVPRLLKVPAPVRFLSCEPLLDEVMLDRWLGEAFGGVEWVIAGGESGPGHRPLNLEHARSVRDQCEQAEVPFFFKQVGGRTPTVGGDLLDGVAHKAFPG